MDGSQADRQRDEPVDAPFELTAEQARVLGCLIEKEATVPDSYPLTLNSLRTACNQSTSRDPVVSYDDRTVEQALVALRELGLTRTVHSTSNRATKYRHVVPDVFGLDPAETAVLCVLMLRGPQTVGELKQRCERQYAFDSTDAVADVLQRLATRTAQPLALQLERRPGQKDARWIQLLSRDAATGDDATGDDTAPAPAPADEVEDTYAIATAEFYDLLAADNWETFGLQLLDLLAEVDPSAGPIVDLGAGTGTGLPYLVAAVPGAEILAVEPSRAMRVALHARLAADESLRRVTTVDPRPLADADLPHRASALVASAVLGHFTDDERVGLWRYLAASLAPGAPAVIEVLPPTTPEQVPPTRYRSLAVGRYTYEGWMEGEPIDAGTMRWTMTYRVLDGDQLVSETSASGPWRCLGVEELRAEVAAHGLSLRELDEAVVVRRAG